NPKSLSDWQLQTVKWSAAQLTAIPEGQPWPLVPFVFTGTDPAVWVLDYGGETPGAGSDTPPTGTQNQEPMVNGGGPSAGGCNAGGSAPDASIGLLLALGALIRRKRK